MANRRRFDNDQEDQIVAHYVGGASLSDLGREWGCPHETIRKVLLRRDIEMRPQGANKGRKPTLAVEVQEQVANEYRKGSTLDGLAQKYGTTRRVVALAVQRQAVDVRSRGKQPHDFSPEERAAMYEFWLAGESLQAVAAACGTSPVTVSRVLREDGVPTHRTRAGKANHLWRPSVIRTSAGYLKEKVAKDDPMAVMAERGTDHPYVMQHRLVMARQFGRPLGPNETVHHVNGIKDDNRLENLQLRIGRHGKGAAARCADCGSTNIEYVRLT